MSHPPYIYTLPEEFLKDPSVPIHWKLYGVINGFWISGKPVFASNAFFAEKLGTTDRHIRRSLEHLEGLGLLDRQIDGLQRYIYPGGRTASVLGGGRWESVGADVGRPHISISKSINTLGADKPRIVIVSDKEPKEREPKADTSYRRVFEAWGPKYPLHWRKNATEIQAAKNILEELTVEDVIWAIKTFEKHKSDPYCPSILKPSDVDRKWDNLVAYEKKKKHG